MKIRHYLAGIVTLLFFLSAAVLSYYAPALLWDREVWNLDQEKVGLILPNGQKFKQLIMMLEEKKMPKISGKLTKELPLPLPGINWEHDDMYHFEMASTGTYTLFMINYNHHYEGNVQPTQRLWYWQNREGSIYGDMYGRRGIFGRSSNFSILSDQAQPLVMFWNIMEITDGAKRNSLQLARIEPAGHDGLNAINLPFKTTSPEIVKVAGDLKNPGENNAVIVSLNSGKILANVPDINTTDRSFMDIDAEIVNGRLVVAGIEVENAVDNVARKNIVRHTFSSNNKSYTTKRISLANDEYLAKLLPKELGSLKIVDTKTLPKLRRNGDLLFRILAEEISGRERVTLYGIVNQPQKGTPMLLTWVIHYSTPNSSTANGKPRDKHIFLAHDDCKVSLTSYQVPYGTDLYYDIDYKSNSLIYFAGGIPWKIALNN